MVILLTGAQVSGRPMRITVPLTVLGAVMMAIAAVSAKVVAQGIPSPGGFSGRRMRRLMAAPNINVAPPKPQVFRRMPNVMLTRRSSLADGPSSQAQA
jgi:hypothetical protein